MVVYLPIIPATETQKPEDHKFEASLGYILNSRPAYGSYQDPVSKNQGLGI
jgi:hypothetical protein